MKYEEKAKALIRVMQSPKFTINIAKLVFFANENFTVLRGKKETKNRISRFCIDELSTDGATVASDIDSFSTYYEKKLIKRNHL